MAAIWKGRVLAGGLGKHVVNHISRPAPLSSTPCSFARIPSYDKNLEDEAVNPSTVPDDMIQTTSDKYWCPDPVTGVFVPVEPKSNGGGNNNTHFTSPSPKSGSWVPDQSAWFRPLEEDDKPPYA
uniref:Late embryogenesis abundant protein At5g17165 isoform X2 n=1 Tax=Elaeis guineensis var. tenera TaxID=51953 RepID=A0A6I9SFY8_ELAGV|nr:late embryogenesis abundant protein At5g17165 isoform X2 [Elaeis guineensis]